MTITTDGRNLRLINNRERTLEAGIKLLDSGESLGIQKVCDLAHVSTRSFYRYWRTLENFERAIVDKIAPWVRINTPMAASMAACPSFVLICRSHGTLGAFREAVLASTRRE